MAILSTKYIMTNWIKSYIFGDMLLFCSVEVLLYLMAAFFVSFSPLPVITIHIDVGIFRPHSPLITPLSCFLSVIGFCLLADTVL